MEMQIDHITSIIQSAKVEATYDGFRIKVNISTDFEQVECASYLYSKNTILFKSGYKNGNKHVFYIDENENDYLKVKVFFRYKYDYAIKVSKYYSVSIKNKKIYKLSKNLLSNIKLSNCEIINHKPDAIEKYEKKGFQPRSDNISYKLTLPIDWLEDPFNDRNWMFQLHAWRMLDAYFNRGNIQDLRYASKIINDWVDFEKINKNKWLWYDMSVGLRALKITYYMSKCIELNIDHGIEYLDYLIHEHLRHLSNPEELNLGNHGVFQLHGLKSLAYIVKRQSEKDYSLTLLKKYANTEMEKIIFSQLGTDGVHTENSPDYHFFVHKRIEKIVDSPWWNDLSESALNLVSIANSAKPWLVFPDNRCVPIGDSSTGVPVNKLPPLEEWPSTKHGAHIGAKVGGYGVIRTIESVPLCNSSFLFLQGSYYSHHHKHADDLSFILQEKGINILIDPGKYSYQKDRFRDYFLSTKAHNTITVDGKNTSRTSDAAYGSAITHAPIYEAGRWLLTGQVNHKMNQYIHTRKIVYLPGKELYVVDVIDNQSQQRKRSLEQWWHFDKNLNVDITQSKQVSIRHPQNLNVLMETETSNASYTYRYFKGYEAGKFLIGWVSDSYLKYEPTPTVRVLTTLEKKTILVTRFIFDDAVKGTPLIFLKEGKLSIADSCLAKYI